MTTSGQFLEKNIWDKSNEELFNEVDQHYDTLIDLDKQQVKNEKSQNEQIRNLALKLEELWKRGQLKYNQREICEKITERLSEKNASKNLRIIVARQLDERFKRKYNNDPEAANVTAVTISEISNEKSLQSQTILEKIKSDAEFAKKHIKHLTASDAQDAQELLSNVSNHTDKYCKENKINYVEYDTSESELDRLRKQAKGEPISCPTPEGIEQNKQKPSWADSDEAIINSLKTKTAKAVYRHACAWRDIAYNIDKFPPTLDGDVDAIAEPFDAFTDLLEGATDIKVKRDNAQWAEIINQYHEVSKHNAASCEDLHVYGVSCKNCGSRMKAIDKKRDLWRLYWRCPNYYRTETQFIGCKKDEPVFRSVSKERITEIQPLINQWVTDVWRTMPTYFAFLYWFRNYKQPYHTEHTVLLEPKFENRGN